jgi:quercetin dioxygenase-like cupin family protein
MKRYSLNETPESPVSHNPEIKKRVLFHKGTVPGLVHLSQVILPKGSDAIEHSHEHVFEVFYCIRGKIIFTVNGVDEPLGAGQCLVVEPDELHSIKDVPEEAEMIYFMNDHPKAY